MTMVQWWCSGVVLNLIFNSPRARQGGGSASNQAASQQGTASHSPLKAISAETGKVMDLTA
jgi:hypothetical protein